MRVCVCGPRVLREGTWAVGASEQSQLGNSGLGRRNAGGA